MFHKLSIKEARIQNGYSKEQLAIKLNVKPKTIDLWEKDGSTISQLHLYALAGICQIPINYLRI